MFFCNAQTVTDIIPWTKGRDNEFPKRNGKENSAINISIHVGKSGAIARPDNSVAELSLVSVA
jgi:hypothetical protein